MTRKSRRNYIKALSSQVERKKMYKAKKQWIVAGISFLVATGLGAVSSKLSTHAAGVKNPVTSAAPNNVNNQKSTTNNASVMKQAGLVHQHLLNSMSNPQSNTNNVNSAKPSSAQSSKVSSKSTNVQSSASITPKLTPYQEYLKQYPQLAHAYSDGATSNVTTSSNGASKKNQPLKMNLGNTSNNIVSGTNYADWTLNKANGDVIFTGGKFPSNNDVNFNSTNGWHGIYNESFGTLLGNDAQYVKHIGFYKGVKTGMNASTLFANFPNLESIDFNNLDTSNAKDMVVMVEGDPKLKTISNLGELNTSNVKTMDSMFAGDSALTTLDLTNFDTHNVVWFGSFLNGLSNLQTIKGLNTLNINSANDMNFMFAGDSKLKSLDLSSFNTYAAIHNNQALGNGNGLGNMISGDNNLKSITLSPTSILTPLAINGNEKGSYGLQTNGTPLALADGQPHPGSWTLLQNLDGNGQWGSANWVLTQNGDLYITNGQITSDISNAKGINGSPNCNKNAVKYIHTNGITIPSFYGNSNVGLFQGLSNLVSVDLSGTDLSKTTSFNHAFESDHKLQQVNLGSTANETSQLANVNNMFLSDYNLQNIQGISDLDTSKTGYTQQGFSSTFQSDWSLHNLDLSGWTITQSDVNNNRDGYFLQNTPIYTLTLGENVRFSQNAGVGQYLGTSHNMINIPKQESINLNDGNVHSGTWTDNAEIINLQNKNGNTVYSEVLQAPATTQSAIENTPLFVPMEYKLDNPSQSFTYNGGITNVPVHLASSDAINSASSLVNSDLIKTQYLASANVSDGNFATNQINSIKGDVSSIQADINTINADRATQNSSNATNEIASANNTYDNAYSANAAIESMMNNSLSSESSAINSVSSVDSKSASSAVSQASINAASIYEKSSDISKLVSGLQIDKNSASTIQNAINSAASSAVAGAETYAEDSLASKASSGSVDDRFNSLFNSGYGNSTISSVAKTVASDLISELSLSSTYETKNSANSKANISDVSNKINSLTESNGTIDKLANTIATSYASSAVNWVNANGTTVTSLIQGLPVNSTIDQDLSSAITTAEDYASSSFESQGTFSNSYNNLFSSSSTSSTIASVANSVANSLISSVSGKNASYSGIVASAANSYANSYVSSLNTSITNSIENDSYETSAAEQADIQSLTSNSGSTSGKISQIASSYANSLDKLLLGSVNTSNTISSIANSYASSWASSASNSYSNLTKSGGTLSLLSESASLSASSAYSHASQDAVTASQSASTSISKAVSSIDSHINSSYSSAIASAQTYANSAKTSAETQAQTDANSAYSSASSYANSLSSVASNSIKNNITTINTSIASTSASALASANSAFNAANAEIDQATNRVIGTETIHLIYNIKNGNGSVVTTSSSNAYIPIDTANSNTLTVSPWSYAKPNYALQNNLDVNVNVGSLVSNPNQAKNADKYSNLSYNHSDTFTYNATQAGDVVIKYYIDTDNNNNKQTVNAKDLGNFNGVAGQSITLTTSDIGSGNDIYGVLKNVPAGYHLAHQLNTIVLQAPNNEADNNAGVTDKNVGLVLMAPIIKDTPNDSTKTNTDNSAKSKTNSAKAKPTSSAKSSASSSASKSSSSSAQPSSASNNNNFVLPSSLPINLNTGNTPASSTSNSTSSESNSASASSSNPWQAITSKTSQNLNSLAQPSRIARIIHHGVSKHTKAQPTYVEIHNAKVPVAKLPRVHNIYQLNKVGRNHTVRFGKFIVTSLSGRHSYKFRILKHVYLHKRIYFTHGKFHTLRARHAPIRIIRIFLLHQGKHNYIRLEFRLHHHTYFITGKKGFVKRLHR